MNKVVYLLILSTFLTSLKTFPKYRALHEMYEIQTKLDLELS